MNVKKYLEEHQVPFEVLHHPRTTGAQQLAQAVHETGRHVAKTVLLRVDHGYRDVVAVLPADHWIDPHQASRMLGGAEVELASEDDVAAHCPDCELGVLSPFGSQYGMSTIIDESLAREAEIVFEGNTHEEAIRLKWDDFCRLEHPQIGTFATPRRR